MKSHSRVGQLLAIIEESACEIANILLESEDGTPSSSRAESATAKTIGDGSISKRNDAGGNRLGSSEVEKRPEDADHAGRGRQEPRSRGDSPDPDDQERRRALYAKRRYAEKAKKKKARKRRRRPRRTRQRRR